jgi:hypothetical protein
MNFDFSVWHMSPACVSEDLGRRGTTRRVAQPQVGRPVLLNPRFVARRDTPGGIGFSLCVVLLACPELSKSSSRPKSKGWRPVLRNAHRLKPVLLNPRFFACRDELWGRQSCLQPAFEPAPSLTCNPDQPAGKPAAAKIGCPTLRLCRPVPLIPRLFARRDESEGQAVCPRRSSVIAPLKREVRP